ncbi:unnamed protein product, partial [Meganyctiphanes norvegica]
MPDIRFRRILRYLKILSCKKTFLKGKDVLGEWGSLTNRPLRRITFTHVCGRSPDWPKNVAVRSTGIFRLIQNLKIIEIEFLLCPKNQKTHLTKEKLIFPIRYCYAVMLHPLGASDPGRFAQFSRICAAPKRKLTCIDDPGITIIVIIRTSDLYGLTFSATKEHFWSIQITKKKNIEEEPWTLMMSRTNCIKDESDNIDVQFSYSKYFSKIRHRGIECFYILHEFVTLHKRRPDPTRRTEDEVELLTIKNALLEKMGVPQEKLPNEFAGLVFGQVSPVCAILGGVIAQEVIKAVTHKDQPHSNFFFFSSQDEAGVIECIGH